MLWRLLDDVPSAPLRRLVVMAEEVPRPRALLASLDARGLVASVLALVEREVDAALGPSALPFYHIGWRSPSAGLSNTKER